MLSIVVVGSIEASTPWFFTWFLKDYVLPAWISLVATEEEQTDQNLSGNQRDRYLVSRACELDVPVITHEAKPKGAVAKEAAKTNVTVLTPAKWIASLGENVEALAAKMLDRVREQMLVFMCNRQEFSRKAEQNCCDYVLMMESILNVQYRFEFPDPLLGWNFRSSRNERAE